MLAVLAIITSLSLIVSCASSTDPIAQRVRDLNACQAVKHSAARPNADPKFIKVIESVVRQHAPKGGVLLCLMPDQKLPYAESATIRDDADQQTLVLWFERKLLYELDDEPLRFVIAHEFGHHIVGGGCPENERRYYLYCEHMIDRLAAKIVGQNSAVLGLTQVMKLMTTRGANAPDIALVKSRIDLLKTHALD
jgi:hypothetical protein